MNLSIMFDGANIAVAVSGGIDSMVLLHKLYAQKEKHGWKLTVAHVNHNLRASAQEDERFVQNFARKLGLEFLGFSVDVKTHAEKYGLSIETAARELRYNALDSVRADFIALAHHQSDQAETVLMNIARGSGMKGGSGMPVLNGRYARPLLDVSKEEIERYAAEHGIPFREDETNADEQFTRNFVRRQILPRFNEINGQAVRNICGFAKRLREDEEFLTRLADDGSVSFNNGGVSVPLKNFDNPPSLWKRQVMLALKNLGICRDVETTHLKQVFELAKSAENGKRLELPCGAHVYKEYGVLTFALPQDKPQQVEISFQTGGFMFGQKYVSVQNGAGRWMFDAAKVPCNAVFRLRKEGDIFAKYGGGSKKLKDYLIDKKVPKRLRDGLLLLVSGNEVLWIENVEVSGKIWVDENTKEIFNITTELRQEEN